MVIYVYVCNMSPTSWKLQSGIICRWQDRQQQAPLLSWFTSWLANGGLVKGSHSISIMPIMIILAFFLSLSCTQPTNAFCKLISLLAVFSKSVQAIDEEYIFTEIQRYWATHTLHPWAILWVYWHVNYFTPFIRLQWVCTTLQKAKQCIQ